MRSGLKLGFAWLLVCWSLLNLNVYAQSDFGHTLENVEVTSLEKYERVALIFNNNFEETPVIDFDLGLIYIRLTNTTINTPTREFVFEQPNRFIKKIQANRNQSSTLLTIVLHSEDLSLENKINLSRSGQRLVLDLDREVIASALANPIPVDSIAEEMEKRLREDGQIATIEPIADDTPIDLSDQEPSLLPAADGWLMTLITLIFSLLLILLLLVLFLFLYNKLLSGKFPAIQGKYKIRTVSTFHLGPKQKIIVLAVNEQYFACGVTANTINFLTEVRDEKDQSFLNDVSLEDGNIQMDTGKARADFLKTLEVARKTAKTMPTSQSPKRKAAKPSQKSTKAQPTSFTTILEEEQTAKAKTKPPTTTKETTSNEPTRKTETPKKKTFHTPVRPPIEEPSLEDGLSGDPSLQKFAKQLGDKLKSLKPIE